MKSENVYYKARMKAAADNKLHASRERTADTIYVSCEALCDYENGVTLPPCDAVQKMVEAYGDPALKGAHIRGCCPLMRDYGDVQGGGLEQAALAFLLLMSENNSLAQDAAVKFAKLAQDGRLDAHEIPEAKEIRAQAVKTRQVMDLAITAIDRALHQCSG